MRKVSRVLGILGKVPNGASLIKALTIKLGGYFLKASIPSLGWRFPTSSKGPFVTNHVVLLGDSVFDNWVYVPGQPAVIELVQSLSPKDWKATLLAVDGSVTTDVWRQLDALPPDASQLVLSVGGNDALRQMGILSEPTHSVAEALERLATMGEQFAQSYSALLEALLSYNLPTVVCTIYNPVFPDPVTKRLATTGLMVFNDLIIRLAAEAGVPLIDLRLVCSDDADFANPIEPSTIREAKIAARIVEVVTRHDFGDRRTTIFS